MVNQLFDGFLKYAEAYPEFVGNYIHTYGKDVKIYQNDRTISKDYTKALGTTYASYMPIGANYDEFVMTHMLIDYEDWGRSVQDGAPADFQLIIPFENRELRTGDLISFDMSGVTLTYKITECSIYHKLFTRATAQLVTNRDGK